MNTSARVGPTSLMSAKKTMNARAVQTTARAAKASRTRVDGISVGQVAAAGPAYTTAATPRQAAVMGKAGTSARWRAATSGAIA